LIIFFFLPDIKLLETSVRILNPTKNYHEPGLMSMSPIRLIAYSPYTFSRFSHLATYIIFQIISYGVRKQRDGFHRVGNLPRGRNRQWAWKTESRFEKGGINSWQTHIKSPCALPAHTGAKRALGRCIRARASLFCEKLLRRCHSLGTYQGRAISEVLQSQKN